MQQHSAQIRTYQATIPVDRLENKVLSYLQKQGSIGERLDMKTIRELFNSAKQEIRLNLTDPVNQPK